MLITDVQTVSDLMSVALHAEHEAIRRYTRLAGVMHRYGNQDAASVFERMAEEEQAHERLIGEWVKLEGIRLSADIGPLVWEDPQVSTDYDGEAIDPAYSTPYRALAFAVHNEERAFHFYAQVAATADDKIVREYAETLAREELGHAALLRAMRRRAWRAEREAGHDEPHIEPTCISTLADLFAVASSAEHCLADNFTVLSSRYPELEKLAVAARGILADTEARSGDVGEPGRDAARAVESIENYKRKITLTEDDPDSLLQRLRLDSDRCFALYDAVMIHSEDEAVMLAAQKLSESVLVRINLLRDISGGKA